MTKSAKRKSSAKTRAPKITAPKVEVDQLASAKAQGQAQFDSIKEMVSALEDLQNARDDSSTDPKDYADFEKAEQTIREDALSVHVRSGWYQPGARFPDTKPAEYKILLCTGGPACRIIGDFDDYGEPKTARLEVQDWFQPWTEFRPVMAGTHLGGMAHYHSGHVLLAYARCFYFGEG